MVTAESQVPVYVAEWRQLADQAQEAQEQTVAPERKVRALGASAVRTEQPTN